MGLYNGATITAAGQNLLAQAISGTELTWTVMRASSVAIPEGTDLTTLTSLTGIEQTTVITDASVYGSNVVQVSARFSNTGIDTAYLMETIGIYGQVTGGSETLIAVMTAETPDEMPVYDADSPSAFIFNVQMSVQNASSLTMVVNDTGTATVADLNRKVDLNGGDLSDTVVDTFTAATAEYPVPAAGDTFKVILGKIIKFFGDIKAAYTNVSVSGKKITFTTAAGGTKEITTQDTTYSAGTALSLSGTTINHDNYATAGTAGQSSASSGRNTIQIPYVTYNAQGHVTGGGTHTHTISDMAGASASAAGQVGLVPAPAAGKQNEFLKGNGTWATPANTWNALKAATSSANGTAGYAPAPTSANYANRALMYLRSDATWQFLPLQNNLTTTAEHYALDARQGKALNDRITSEHIVREVINFDLDAATWTETAQGKYIATVKQYATGNVVLGVSLGTLGNLRATDVVQPCMTGDGGRTISIMSNTKSFANTSATVQIYVMYRPA